MKKIVWMLLIFTVGFCGNVYAYEVISVNAGGSVSGRVLFKGNIPAAAVMPINKDFGECGSVKRVVHEVKVKGDALSNVVVFIADIKKGKSFNIPKNGFRLIQEKCRFYPHVQVVKQNSNLSIINKDSAAHNIHTFELGENFVRTLFNRMQPDANFIITEKVRLRRSRIMKVECDIHPFMHAWVFVADNPYFVVVEDDGTFKIEGVPVGQYSIMAWNPVLGYIEQDMAVSSNADTFLRLEFKGE